MNATLPAIWPHQARAEGLVLDAIRAGQNKILVTVPTGGGKTRIETDLLETWLDERLMSVLYTNRKLLVEQTQRVMEGAGIKHGVRASGWDADLGRDVQVSSIQTEHARCIRSKQWALHNADRVLVDEAHLQKSAMAQKVFGLHEMDGAVRVGLTATPLDLADMYDQLIVGATLTELRECGALVAARHFGCDEPDLRKIGKVPLGDDLTEKQIREVIMRPGVFARVLEWYTKLNPERKPAILFAPDVAGSIWFAEQFEAAGITAAHIDGLECWWNGELQKTNRGLRHDILKASKAGRVKVLCNRFVLREGIDCPWLEHGILATVFGSLQSYLQSGGRLLRSSPGKTEATIQDHGGNWWRHGSLNMDRHWELTYTPRIVAGLREWNLQEKLEPEPIRCPACGGVRIWRGPRCPTCGHEMFDPTKKSRPVVQADGSLKEHKGDIFRPRHTAMKADTQALWTQCYYRCKNSGRTFRQAEGLFVYENHYWAPRTLKYQPIEEFDWFKKIDEVPKERLRS